MRNSISEVLVMLLFLPRLCGLPSAFTFTILHTFVKMQYNFTRKRRDFYLRSPHPNPISVAKPLSNYKILEIPK